MPSCPEEQDFHRWVEIELGRALVGPWSRSAEYIVTISASGGGHALSLVSDVGDGPSQRTMHHLQGCEALARAAAVMVAISISTDLDPDPQPIAFDAPNEANKAALDIGPAKTDKPPQLEPPLEIGISSGQEQATRIQATTWAWSLRGGLVIGREAYAPVQAQVGGGIRLKRRRFRLAVELDYSPPVRSRVPEGFVLRRQSLAAELDLGMAFGWGQHRRWQAAVLVGGRTGFEIPRLQGRDLSGSQASSRLIIDAKLRTEITLQLGRFGRVGLGLDGQWPLNRTSYHVMGPTGRIGLYEAPQFTFAAHVLMRRDF